jgi:hypothetical protein
MEVSREIYSPVELSLDEGSLVQVGTIQQSYWTWWRNTNSVRFSDGKPFPVVKSLAVTVVA